MNSREDERLGEIFNPFRDPYLADPYAFFADARSTTPVFHSPLIKYWVVTRHRDIRQIFESPKLFSAANALSPIQPPCAEARRLLSAGGVSPVPTLTNVDPPAHTRVRRLANAAFKPKRVAVMDVPIQNLDPDVLMMEPAEDWSRRDAADLLPSPELWSILIQ
jgi:cytochrome P450